jgi:hypothetical protein
MQPAGLQSRIRIPLFLMKSLLNPRAQPVPHNNILAQSADAP